MTQAQNNTPKANILAVDDTPANLRLLIGILTECGYNVRAMPNGKLALSGLHLSLPDLILLDINMPEMDGYQVCQQLKADERTRDIPVIFISALDDVLDKVKAFEVGGVDYITKPFQVAEVLARVETHLSLRQLQQRLQQQNETLASTLQQLEATQEELIQSEKMAVLGQLIASIAHDINTPLGAISSSASNINDFLKNSLEPLIDFLGNLSPEQKSRFLTLLQHSQDRESVVLSIKEQRKVRRELSARLEDYGIEDTFEIASDLVSIGAYNDFEAILPILQDAKSSEILKNAYELAVLQISTRTIANAAERASKIVFSLKTYARRDYQQEKIEANIIDGIESVLVLYQNQLKQGIIVNKNYSNVVPAIACYPDELNQVWMNLIHNALQAMNNTGTLDIEVVPKEEMLCVSITDSGKGIPLEIQEKIFKPFFTTKRSGEGSGLGLDIVKKIIDKHHGTIAVESIPGKTMFVISLPMKWEP